MAGYQELFEILETREGVMMLSPEDLRGYAEEILGDVEGDQRLAYQLARRADMLELNAALPRVDAEISDWLSTPAEDRVSNFPNGEAIAEVQRLLNLDDDGLLGPDTLAAILTDAQSELRELRNNSGNLLPVPIQITNLAYLNAQMHSNDPNGMAAYSADYERFSQEVASGAAQNSLLSMHEEMLGMCSEVEILSMQSIFENPEQFAGIIALAHSDNVRDIASLNAALSDIIAINCAHILDKFPEDQRAGVLANAALETQLALTNTINIAKQRALEAPVPETPPSGPSLPNTMGPNGETDASMNVTVTPPSAGVKL